MNQNCDDIKTRIQDWAETTFPQIKKQGLGDSDSLLDTGIIDSLGTLEVVQFLEEEFRIHVADEEMLAENFDSIDSISLYVRQKLPR